MLLKDATAANDLLSCSWMQYQNELQICAHSICWIAI